MAPITRRSRSSTTSAASCTNARPSSARIVGRASRARRGASSRVDAIASRDALDRARASSARRRARRRARECRRHIATPRRRMFARRSTSDGAFTLSKRASTTTATTTATLATAPRDGRVTLDDVEEFVEERKRAANDARARSVGNALLAASLAWSAARRAWEAWRRRREARATATTEREEAEETEDDARDDARDERRETREGS